MTKLELVIMLAISAFLLVLFKYAARPGGGPQGRKWIELLPQ